MKSHFGISVQQDPFPKSGCQPSSTCTSGNFQVLVSLTTAELVKLGGGGGVDDFFLCGFLVLSVMDAVPSPDVFVRSLTSIQVILSSATGQLTMLLSAQKVTTLGLPPLPSAQLYHTWRKPDAFEISVIIVQILVEIGI